MTVPDAKSISYIIRKYSLFLMDYMYQLRVLPYADLHLLIFQQTERCLLCTQNMGSMKWNGV